MAVNGGIPALRRRGDERAPWCTPSPMLTVPNGPAVKAPRVSAPPSCKEGHVHCCTCPDVLPRLDGPVTGRSCLSACICSGCSTGPCSMVYGEGGQGMPAALLKRKDSTLLYCPAAHSLPVLRQSKGAADHKEDHLAQMGLDWYASDVVLKGGKPKVYWDTHRRRHRDRARIGSCSCVDWRVYPRMPSWRRPLSFGHNGQKRQYGHLPARRYIGRSD